MKILAGMALVAAAGSAQAAIVYDNLPGAGESYFTSGSSPRTSLADDFVTGIANLQVQSVKTLIVNQNTAASSMILRISIWDGFDVNGNVVGLLGQAAYQFNNVGVGGFFTGDLAVAANVADGDGVVSFEYFSTAGTRLTSGWTIGFDGSGVNVGSSQDVYWRDVNNDGAYAGTETRSFGGAAGSLANLAFNIQGIPTPGTLALIGLGGLAAGRRRR